MPSFLKAFQSYNYRLYFSGQSISLIGTWMQRTAVYWLVYEKTQSAAMLGVAVFAAQFPSFMFSIIGGVVSDRYNRYYVLILTQILSLVQAALMTALLFFHYDTVWAILSLSVVLGTINAFDVPARQALVYDMVDNKEHLPNAIALNSSMVNVARLIGPAMSGIVLETLGATVCFLINTISFVAVITSLLLMRLPKFVPKERVNNAWADLKQGFTYLRSTPSISTVMLMLASVSLLSLPYITLLPVYARTIFMGQASTFGYLNSFVGVGAVSGAIFLASLKPGTDLRKILLRNTLIFSAGLLLFSYTTYLPLALAFLAIAGFGMMSQTTLSNTIIQTTVAPAMRGRVISFYAMAFFGMQPIGGLIIGSVSHAIGAPLTILFQGIATLIIALAFLPYLRRDLFKRKQRLKMDQLEEQSIETTS